VTHVPVDLLVLGGAVEDPAAEGAGLVGGFLADCAREVFGGERGGWELGMARTLGGHVGLGLIVRKSLL